MLTHGNVVADFSGFLKVTEVNKVDSLMQVSLGDTLKLKGFYLCVFVFSLIQSRLPFIGRTSYSH